jgi:FixJ family two-component response regulator
VEAFTRSPKLQTASGERAAPQGRYDGLTSRERAVLPLLLAGLMKKVSAARPGAAGTTVRIQSGPVMEKMAERLGLRPAAAPARGAPA